VAIERTRAAGPVHVGYQFWKRLGMDDILGALKYLERAIQLTCCLLQFVQVISERTLSVPDLAHTWFAR